jgi:hypothetical protein
VWCVDPFVSDAMSRCDWESTTDRSRERRLPSSSHAQRMRLCRAETTGLYNHALRLISILSEAAWHSTLDPHAAHVVQTCHDSSIILPGQKVFRRQTGPQHKTPCVGMHLPSHAAASPTRTGAWPCALLQGCTFPAFQDYSTRWLCNTIWNRLCIM